MRASLLAVVVVWAMVVSAAQGAQFTLIWSDNSTNELGFVIERAPGLNATLGFVEIGGVETNVTTYIDAGLPDGVSYSYRVRAWNLRTPSGPIQYSAYSNVASGTTPAPEAPPAAPGTLQITWPAKLVNLSTRVPPADLATEPVVAGFVITGGPKRVLIRAVGPGLAQFGVPDVLADPRLQVVGGPGSDNWSGEAVIEATAKVGAFPLVAGSKDAALVVVLDTGSWTVHVDSVDGGRGTVLVEVYEVP